ncbi:hypothetical protein CJD36_015425 [Flavipsychrobacter stenotrophus]|uniref:Nucleotidyltransferase n=1 Tax=Flavipsychrobacter stenotrophus TaxID=2077091 RepID=A0A2S7SU83_9BACT|nr:hypothetical protein [Flavipsychrobacter stenotrophus]PQJ10086.1 hypothetical protein CJD36_015425 [Flavipsychrobacter stenotrophus]
MDVQDEELLHFWKCLARHSVRYIMIGGFATRFHGFNRSTEDLDIWLEDTIVNRQQLRTAFIEIGYGDVPQLETMEFIPGWTNFYIAGVELDIMTSMKGLENMTFDECLQQASIAELDEVKIPFLHINQLIQNKRTINRPKDQIDVIELERIRDIREQKQ